MQRRILLRSVIILVSLFCVVHIDVRPSTIRSRPAIAAQVLTVIDCDVGCYALGNHPLRIIFDYDGRMSIIIFEAHALTKLSAIPMFAALAFYDPVSACGALLIYVISVAQARSSAPTLQQPITRIPDNATCIIVGVNDYVETYALRTNHSCGYINYVGTGVNITEKYYLKPRFFAETAAIYGDQYDVIFLDRDAEGDVGLAISSVPEKHMAMGVKFKATRMVQSVRGTNQWKRQTRVIVTRLAALPSDERAVMVDALKGWARFRPWMMPNRKDTGGMDSTYALYNETFLDMFVESDKQALGKHCSRKFLNRGDCLHGRLDSVLAVDWGSLAMYCVLVAGMYLSVVHLRRKKIKDVVISRRILVAMLVLCCFLAAFATGLTHAKFDDWEPMWIRTTSRTFHFQMVLLIVLATRISWKCCEAVQRIWFDRSKKGSTDSS